MGAVDLVRETEGAVGVVTIDSPGNANALSTEVLEGLVAKIGEADADPGLRVIVLTARGRVFCSGADLKEPSARGPILLPEVFRMLRETSKPVIARVNGAVRGGGIGLVAASDLAVAVAEATFAFSEVRVGVVPAMVAVPVLAVMDRRAFARWSLTGERFGADEAYASGLLTAVAVDVDLWVRDAVVAITKGAPGALAATRGLRRELEGLGFEAGMATMAERSAEAFGSAEAAEGMAAFAEKREPSWTVP